MRRGLVLSWVLVTAVLAPAAEVERGLELFRAGRFAEAETVFGAAWQGTGELPALFWRGRARAAQERWAEAAADYRAVLERKPESVPSRLALAAALEKLSRLPEAVCEYCAVLELEPGNEEAAEATRRLAAAPSRPTVAQAPPLTAALPPPVADETAGPRLGPHLAVLADGLPSGFGGLLTDGRLDADGGQLLDYTFGSAPTEWEPTCGVWRVSSRFACDPSWSFFGGYSRGLAAIWNKREFVGDIVVEAYVSFKHGLPWNSQSWGYRPADLCLTLCGQGDDPASGYSFIYAGDEGSRTMIRRGDRVLAETSDPRFLSPSYNDVRPATEEFHRRWWQLVASKSGDRLTFYVDGRQALEVTDPEPLDGGRIALWTVHNGMMVARVRVAYQAERVRRRPAVVVAEPVPLPAQVDRLAAR